MTDNHPAVTTATYQVDIDQLLALYVSAFRNGYMTALCSAGGFAEDRAHEISGAVATHMYADPVVRNMVADDLLSFVTGEPIPAAEDSDFRRISVKIPCPCGDHDHNHGGTN